MTIDKQPFVMLVILAVFCTVLAAGCSDSESNEPPACSSGVYDSCNVCDGDGTSCLDCSAESGNPCSDLLIESFSYNSTSHEFLVEVTNQGSVAATAVEIGFVFNQAIAEPCAAEQMDGVISVPNISSNETVSLTSRGLFDISVMQPIAQSGTHSAQVLADWNCGILESDESNNEATIEFSITDLTQYSSRGLHGYIGSYSSFTPETYRYGASFYSSVWSLIEKPIANFQIGLPGTWFTPNNSDNVSEPLCPVGTMARDNWPERAPTYQDVFQTMEGGLGYWAGNRFHYGPPKYSMNATPDCYNNQIASPGWPFFGSSAPLSDNLLGIAQLSNRMLIPPDGLPFDGEPRGELVGYGYIALPLTEPRSDPQPTGNQNWTLFLNSENFKGPLAYYLPETWSKISRDYPFDHGRGLDARPIRDGLAGSMEINTVPQFQSSDSAGVRYSKIPVLQFPINDENKTVLVRDVTFYSKQALFNSVANWKNGGEAPSGTMSSASQYQPSVSTWPVTYSQNDISITGINEKATPTVFDGNVFGLEWSEPGEGGFGKFPQYFRHEGDSRIAVEASEVPWETLLHHKEFREPSDTPSPYTVGNLEGSWANPGPLLNTYEVTLTDCSSVTYRWYRFIDQPVFQQFNWTDSEKNSLQSIVEKIHTHWSIEQDYLPSPGDGALASFDPALIVTPPSGLEMGYVPVVVNQEKSTTGRCASEEQLMIETLTREQLLGAYERVPVENGWHSVSVEWDGASLWWRNEAGSRWSLTFTDGILNTGEDCPYGVSTLSIRLAQDAAGNYLPEVTGLIFNNELYQR